ncbi:MAG: cytochrome C oxidase subunit IV family protein [Myxococcota bacterium]|nr:cytochrome C oxidase subunit IV family protein [Myxococcota bacterium]MDW8363724.1 cytochrome C oxidase subunit IV family protein [Myxococcales bacterium]
MSDAHPSDRFAVLVWAALLAALLGSLALGAFVPTTMVVVWVFAVAVLKAGLVLYQYMHLKHEPRWVRLVVFGSLAVVAALLAGTIDDIVVAPGRL